MNKIKGLYLVLLLVVFSPVVLGQSYKKKPENFFGFQVRPLIPIGVVGDRPFNLSEEGMYYYPNKVNGDHIKFDTRISQLTGYSFGGVVRVGMTELLAIETGMNFTKRRYKADYTVTKIDTLNQKSVLETKDDVGFINFDVPVNLLVYVRLGKQMFMNVSVGVNVGYNPSNIRSPHTPDDFKQDVFILEGRRFNYFDFGANAEVGFEYRTERAGIFYLGLSGKVPFTKMMQIATAYEYDTFKLVSRSEVTGAFAALQLKYFFHNNNRKPSIEVEKGPVY